MPMAFPFRPQKLAPSALFASQKAAAAPVADAVTAVHAVAEVAGAIPAVVDVAGADGVAAAAVRAAAAAVVVVQGQGAVALPRSCSSGCFITNKRSQDWRAEDTKWKGQTRQS